MPCIKIQRYDLIHLSPERDPVLWLAYTGDLDGLKRQLAEIDDVTVVRDTKTNTSILGWAVVGDQVAIIKYLVDRYPQLLKSTNKYGATPLFLCSVAGNVDMFKLFIKKGLSPYQLGVNQETVLMLAAARGHLNLTRYIIEKYPDMLKKKSNFNMDVFLYSCYSGRVDMFEYMLQLNLDPTVSDIDGINCLMIIAWRGHENLLRYILQNASRLHIDIHAVDCDGDSAVFYSMFGSHPHIAHPHIANILVEAGVEPPVKTSYLVNQYLRLFSGHKEKYRHIRVVFVGPENVGKTTLCLRLQREQVDISDRRPTLGAELFLQLYEIGWDSKRWKLIKTEEMKDVIHKRFATMFRMVEDTEDSQLDTNTPVLSHHKRQFSSEKRNDVSDGFAVDRAEAPHDQSNFSTDFRVEETSLVHHYSQEQDEDVAFLSMWDMGGDLAFQITNSVFISAHGVYILTFRAIDYFTDNMQIERLQNWVRNIGAYCHVYDPNRQRKHLPPIILVGTHMDQVKDMFKNETQDVILEKILDMQDSICAISELKATRKTDGLKFVFLKFCTVDNSIDDDPAFEKIRGYILEAAAYQDQWERELPTTWLALEREILKKRQESSVITLQEVMDIGAKCEVPMLDKDEIRAFLEYLHSTRSVLYFRKYKKVIINPPWFINALREIITEEKFLPNDDLLLRADLIKYTRKAILTVDLAMRLWQTKEENSFIQHNDILFAFLEEFGLVVKACLGQDSDGQPIYDDDYTVPSKLQKAPDMDHISDVLQAEGTVCSRTLCLEFEDVFTPQELFDRIYAGVIRTFKPASEICPKTANQFQPISRDLGCFEIDDLCNMVVRMQWERSVIAVTLFTTTESQIPDDTGRKVRQKLETIIRHTLEVSRQEHLEYRYTLHCRFYLKQSDHPREEDGIVRARRGLPCQGEECSGKHILTKRDWNIWFPESKTSEVKDIKRPYECELLTDKGLQERVAENLGAGWECVLRCLKVTNSKIERIKMDHVGSCLNQITTALIYWRNNYPEDRSETDMLKDLSEAFRENGVNSDVIEDELERMTK